MSIPDPICLLLSDGRHTSAVTPNPADGLTRGAPRFTSNCGLVPLRRQHVGPLRSCLAGVLLFYVLLSSWPGPS